MNQGRDSPFDWSGFFEELCHSIWMICPYCKGEPVHLVYSREGKFYCPTCQQALLNKYQHFCCPVCKRPLFKD